LFGPDELTGTMAKDETAAAETINTIASAETRTPEVVPIKFPPGFRN